MYSAKNHNGLSGFFDPLIDMWYGLTTSETAQIGDMVHSFPEVLDQAISDWAKFKIAYKNQLISQDQLKIIMDWFLEFPQLWETVRPSFESTEVLNDPELVRKADNFVERFQPELMKMQLGLATIIIGSVIIAAALGVGAAIWGIGYIKKQNNITMIIEGATAGKISEDVLREAVKQEAGIMSAVGGSIGTLVLVAGAVLLAPRIMKMIKK